MIAVRFSFGSFIDSFDIQIGDNGGSRNSHVANYRIGGLNGQVRIAYLIVSFVFILNFGYAQSVGRTWTDLAYVDDGLVGHTLDIYLPEEGEGLFPVIVAIAGSAWFGEDTKGRAYQIASSLREEGFAIVAVNHRSSRQAIFPAQIHDIKAAVRFIRGSSEDYSLDSRFVGIMGDSSGGHLSALMGSTRGVQGFSVESVELSIEGGLGNYIDESSSVDAVVDWYGPTDFQKMDTCGSSFSHDAVDSPESTIVGGPIQENDAMCAFANPITYIDSEDPAFLILHGDADPLVPVCQSELLHEALVAKSVPSELIVVPDGGHGQGMWIPEYTNRMTAFFAEQMKLKLSD